MFKELVSALKEKHYTISSVESLTAGLFSAQIASVSGASAVLKGGLITYASEFKTLLANVDSSLIEKHGVVSSEVAEAMARGGKSIMNTDICVSFTGNAGPAVLDNKKVGEVYIGIVIHDKTRVFHEIFTGDRNEIRNKVCNYACEKIINLIN